MGEEVNLLVYLLEAVGNSLVESILLTKRRETKGSLLLMELLWGELDKALPKKTILNRYY